MRHAHGADFGAVAVYRVRARFHRAGSAVMLTGAHRRTAPARLLPTQRRRYSCSAREAASELRARGMLARLRLPAPGDHLYQVHVFCSM
jgi:hypothetical protein